MPEATRRVVLAAAELVENWRDFPAVQDMSLDEMHELQRLLDDLSDAVGSGWLPGWAQGDQ